MAAREETNKPLPQKSYRTILYQEIIAGLAELKRPTGGLLLSSLSAGLDIGFSLLLMAVMLSAVAGRLSDPVTDILVANMYSVGFILVILGRSELFTEQYGAGGPSRARPQGLAHLHPLDDAGECNRRRGLRRAYQIRTRDADQ